MKLRSRRPAPTSSMQASATSETTRMARDTLVFAALAGAGAGVLERFMQIAAGHSQAGDKAKEHCGGDSNQYRPAQSGAVDVQRAEQWQSNRALMREPPDEDDANAKPKQPRLRWKEPGSR